MTTTTTTNIAPPADATDVSSWQHIFNDRERHRWFYGTSRPIEDAGMSLRIGGFQSEDGAVRQRIAYVMHRRRRARCDERPTTDIS
jgi:hypothetical protein